MSFLINNNISQIRVRRKLTQEELAQAVNVSRQTIIALEKGNYIPSLLLAMSISRYFGLTIEKIFTLEELS